MNRHFFAVAALAIPVLAGCSWAPRIPGVTPYKIEIQQGNFVSAETVSQLKPGMSKEQVRNLLGTPLLNGIFYAERWDYVYWREPSNGKRERHNLALFFDDGKLARLSGDLAPGGSPQ